MKQQFVETIKIKNGKALALPYHHARMERTISHLVCTSLEEFFSDFSFLILITFLQRRKWISTRHE